MTAEEEVRAAWESVIDSDYGVDIVIGTGRLRFNGLLNRWILALAFTEQRLREIAEAEACIAWLEDTPCSNGKERDAILAREQAHLESLKRGMK